MATKTRRRDYDVQERQDHNGFSLDARQIGVAVASVLVTEIANIAVQKLSEKILKKDGPDDLAADNGTSVDDEGNSNPLYAVAAQAGDGLGKAESSAGEVVDAVRSSIGNLKISLSDVIDVLRDAGQHLKDQSASTVSASSAAVLENVSNSATAVRDRIVPEAKAVRDRVVPEVKQEFKKARKNKKRKKSKKNKN